MDSSDILRRLIAFDTVSSKSNLALIEWVQRYLERWGVDAHIVQNDDGSKANLFATFGPERNGGIVLSGHTDVVPVDGQPWSTDPFVMTEADGRLYGRGTSDMKAFVACALAATREFVERDLRTPIYLALSYDEETGCHGVPKLIERFGQGLPQPAIAIVGEPSEMRPMVAHKGVMAFETRFTGKDVHSSLPHLGANAIRAATEFINFLYSLADEFALGGGLDAAVPPYPTVNVGRIAGGQAINIVARECIVGWEIRFTPDRDPVELCRRVDDFFRNSLLMRTRPELRDHAIQTRQLAMVPAFEASSHSRAERLARELTGNTERLMVPFGAEAGLFAAAGVDTVICGPGSIEQAHQPNEFIALSQLHQCDDFMTRLAAWAQTAPLAD